MKIYPNKIPLFLLAITITILTSCAAKTYYLRDASNGFTDLKISDTVYSISVKSRNVKEEKRLQDMFYLRAAEIALENDYPFFYTVEDVKYLSDMDPKAKPFKRLILTITFYESITISGVVKLLKERPRDIPFQIFSTQQIYKKNQYLILEKENIFGKTTPADTEEAEEEDLSNPSLSDSEDESAFTND